MTVSNRKLKAFDRRGGAYLVLPWPADLPQARGTLRCDDERPATQREHLAAMRMAAATARENGLLHLASTVAVLRPPSPGQEALYLLAHMVTPRWQAVTTPGGAAPALWPS